MSVIQHEIVTVKLAELKDDPTNPNTFSKEQHAGLRKSYQKFGNLKLLVIDNDNMIIDGHQRASELKALGETETKALRVHPKSQAERILIRQTLNKLYGEHDKKLDSNDYLVLFQNQQLGELAELLAKPQEEFQRALEKHHGIEFVKEDDFDVEKALQEPPITKLGDVWQLGRHRLMVGDATKESDVSALMNGKTVDMVLTDPPYGVDYGSKNRFLNAIGKPNSIEEPIVSDQDIADYRKFYMDFLRLIPLSDYNNVYVFQLGTHIHDLRLALDDAGYTWSSWLVWVKNNHVLGRSNYHMKHEFICHAWKKHHKFYGDFSTSILQFDKPQASKLHPTMKPIDLLSKLLMDGSFPDAIVYECFAGSGSTLIACEQLGRSCYCLEITPTYASTIIKRFESTTGQKAELISSNDRGNGQIPHAE
jgi:DNA modification methylase